MRHVRSPQRSTVWLGFVTALSHRWGPYAACEAVSWRAANGHTGGTLAISYSEVVIPKFSVFPHQPPHNKNARWTSYKLPTRSAWLSIGFSLPANWPIGFGQRIGLASSYRFA